MPVLALPTIPPCEFTFLHYPTHWAERPGLPTLNALLLEGEPILAALGVREMVPLKKMCFLDEHSSRLAAEATTDGQKCLLEKMWLYKGILLSKAFLIRGRSKVTGGGRVCPRSQRSLGLTFTRMHDCYLSSSAQGNRFLASEIGLDF